MKTASQRHPQPAPTRDTNDETAQNNLNAYAICNPSALTWPVNLYMLEPANGQEPQHQDRGDIKNAIWTHRGNNKQCCRGYGYVVDIDERTVAVPATWELPTGVEVEGYWVSDGGFVQARADTIDHAPIVLGVLREAVKKHFKDNLRGALGSLWQDGNGFCQMPLTSSGQGDLFCRKFTVVPRLLKGDIVLQLVISTVTLDGRTMDLYLRQGKASALADRIHAKQANRMTRKGDRTSVRVWWDQRTEHQEAASIVDLADPNELAAYGQLPPLEQAKLAAGSALCQPFKKPAIRVPLYQLRLVLDTQITREDHRETIIDPHDRLQLTKTLRDFLDGMDAYGLEVRVNDSMVGCGHFLPVGIIPPAVRIKGPEHEETVLARPGRFSHEDVSRRARTRAAMVRRNGFLMDRHLNPVLAGPECFGADRLARMRRDLDFQLQKRGIQYRFAGLLYRNVDHLRSEVEKGGFNALLAVLPEDSSAPEGSDDTHEQIKRRIEVPSQCIHHDNTLPAKLVQRGWGDLREHEPKVAKRISNHYEICIENLLVKCAWVPFVPAEPFHYNVHVGIDVGGRNNNRVVACLGYGFARPQDGLVFRPQEIPVVGGGAEPIPTNALLAGLSQLFDYARTELTNCGITPDFERVLFFRDGAMVGKGGEWNEKEALSRLHAKYLKEGTVTDASVWSVAEIHKRAERWRVFSSTSGTVDNPLVGFAALQFDGPNDALVCTTGRPYLTQGTAEPLMVHVENLHGNAVLSEVIRDLIWEADMGFTKPDMGRGFPWVLHVADAGALQLSRSYKIAGITT